MTENSGLSGGRRWLAPVLFALAFFVLVTGGVWNLHPSWDDERHMERALEVAGGRLDIGWYAYPHALYYIYAGLYAAAYAMGLLLGQFHSPEEFHAFFLQSRVELFQGLVVANALFGSIGVALLFATLRRVSRPPIAAGVTALYATNTYVLSRTETLMPEGLLQPVVILVLYFCCQYMDRPRRRFLILGGACAGLACALKFNALLGVVCVLLTARSGLPGETVLLRTRAFLRRTLIACAAISAAFFASSPFTVLKWKTVLGILTQAGPFSAGNGGRVINEWVLEYQLKDTAFLSWFVELLARPGTLWLGALPLTLVVLLLPLRARHVPFLGAMGAHLLLLSVTPLALQYHILPMIPVMHLSLGLAVHRLSEWRPSWGMPGLANIGIAVLLTLQLGGTWTHVREKLRPDSRILARRWIESHVPNGTRIIESSHHGPRLQRSDAQVRAEWEELQDRHPGAGKRLLWELRMTKPHSYHIDFLPFGGDFIGPDGRVDERKLTPLNSLADQGYEYVILSSMDYRRFDLFPDLGQVARYYREMLRSERIVYSSSRVDGEGGFSGPEITVLRLR